LEAITVRFKGLMLFLSGVLASLAMGWFAFPAALYKTEAQPMQFNHAIHTGEQNGMTCDICHEFTENGSFKGIPTIAKCTECHAASLGSTETEKVLVEQFVTPQKEIPWKVYSRQPDNAFFPHAVHVKRAELKCEECHGMHGSSSSLPVYQVNRISGYSRDIWGRNISGIPSHPWEGMKMDRCVRCHAERHRDDSCLDCHK
jgi:menaquinone reductase, multiheme cytochrome c subunit